jgi:hypothetical protein
MTVSTGNPWADFARTSMLLTIGPKGAGRMVSPMVRMIISLFHQTYSTRYMKQMHGGVDDYRKWIPVIATARLNERIEPEREALIEIVEQGVR